MSEWWQASDEQVLAALGAAQRRLNAEWAAMLPLVAEAHNRGLAERGGFKDTAHLLRGAQNVALPVAKTRIAAATAVLPGCGISGTALPPELREVASAVAEAAVSAEHVRVIQACLAALPPHLGEHRDALEADLVGFARQFDPDTVAKLGRRALAALDPDGPRPRDGAPTRTRLTFHPCGKGFEARGWFTIVDAATLRSALSPLSAPAPAADTGEHDPRSTAERQGDALVELARRMLDSGGLPVEGGTRPQVTVTVSLAALQTGEGSAQIGFGDGTLTGSVDVEEARRQACDPLLIPLALDFRGAPLSVGREQRLVTRAMRRALNQRDGGCAFPGCECPPQWCAAHHVVHWARGGVTAVENLVLLCPRHHTVIHQGEWTVVIADGFPWFHPPAWMGGSPRRNLIHRPDLIAIPPQDRPPVKIARIPARL